MLSVMQQLLPPGVWRCWLHGGPFVVASAPPTQDAQSRQSECAASQAARPTGRHTWEPAKQERNKWFNTPIRHLQVSLLISWGMPGTDFYWLSYQWGKPCVWNRIRRTHLHPIQSHYHHTLWYTAINKLMETVSHQIYRHFTFEILLYDQCMDVCRVVFKMPFQKLTIETKVNIKNIKVLYFLLLEILLILSAQSQQCLNIRNKTINLLQKTKATS